MRNCHHVFRKLTNSSWATCGWTSRFRPRHGKPGPLASSVSPIALPRLLDMRTTFPFLQEKSTDLTQIDAHTWTPPGLLRSLAKHAWARTAAEEQARAQGGASATRRSTLLGNRFQTASLCTAERSLHVYWTPASTSSRLLGPTCPCSRCYGSEFQRSFSGSPGCQLGLSYWGPHHKPLASCPRSSLLQDAVYLGETGTNP